MPFCSDTKHGKDPGGVMRRDPGLTHLFSGLTHHNSELRITGKPCLLVKHKLLDHIFAMFR